MKVLTQPCALCKNKDFLNQCHCDHCDLYLRKISPKIVKASDP